MSWITRHPSPHKVEALRERLLREQPAQWQWATEYAGADQEDFALWLFVANIHVMRRWGMPLYDGEDWAWRDAYDDDTSPGTAAAQYVSACN